MATSKIECNGWKLQGTATGGNAISLPTSYSELFVVTEFSRARVTTAIPKDIVGNGLSYYGGYYAASNNNIVASWKTSDNGANISLIYFLYDGSTSRLGDSTTKLYYK